MRKNKGFTLLELLIVLFIISILIIIVVFTGRVSLSHYTNNDNTQVEIHEPMEKGVNDKL